MAATVLRCFMVVHKYRISGASGRRDPRLDDEDSEWSLGDWWNAYKFLDDMVHAVVNDCLIDETDVYFLHRTQLPTITSRTDLKNFTCLQALVGEMHSSETWNVEFNVLILTTSKELVRLCTLHAPDNFTNARPEHFKGLPDFSITELGVNQSERPSPAAAGRVSAVEKPLSVEQPPSVEPPPPTVVALPVAAAPETMPIETMSGKELVEFCKEVHGNMSLAACMDGRVLVRVACARVLLRVYENLSDILRGRSVGKCVGQLLTSTTMSLMDIPTPCTGTWVIPAGLQTELDALEKMHVAVCVIPQVETIMAILNAAAEAAPSPVSEEEEAGGEWEDFGREPIPTPSPPSRKQPPPPPSQPKSRDVVRNMSSGRPVPKQMPVKQKTDLAKILNAAPEKVKREKIYGLDSASSDDEAGAFR